MSVAGNADGSEDVADFLERIKELGDRRHKEDEERARKLEEEILQGRKERQARRAERARSISPTKDSPLTSQPPSTQSQAESSTYHRSSPTPLTTRGGAIASSGSALGVGDKAFKIDAADSPSKFEPMKPKPPIGNNTLSRSGTLSWQQRPQSSGSPTGKRLSKSEIQQEDEVDSGGIVGEDSMEGNKSLDKLAQTFEKKDPTWFRQTADRGLGSAAYRKNQDTESHIKDKNVELLGLTRRVSAELSNMQSHRSIDMSLAPDEETKSNTVQAEKTSTWKPSSGATRSPLPLLSSQRLEPPPTDTATSLGHEVTSDRTPAVSASSGRTSPDRVERPASPTKGLGGFVQSAMMKRSDSVNKRWSAQAATGLSRGNSIASNRGGLDSFRGSVHGRSSILDADPVSQSRELSPLSSSRPGSSHSPSAASRPHKISADLEAQSFQAFGSSKSSMPEQNMEKSHEDTPAPRPDETSRPSSPTKFADQKRWSPTKSSWLETAINKPDSPRPKPNTPQQPSWMAEINRAKQAREAGDMGKSSNHKEVPIGGFLRSPPMGSSLKSPSQDNFSHTTSSDKTATLGRTSTFPKANEVEAESSTPKTSERIESTSPAASVVGAGSNFSQGTWGPNNRPDQREEKQKMAAQKTKPITPPKTDFRAGLKSRHVAEDKDSTNQPEFRSVFGKLKKAETKNYVAPDELKNNILRGKAGLALTGGPKKSERRDEFKEDILRRKEEMTVAGEPAKSPPHKEAVKIPIPEAIARKKDLSSTTASIKSTRELGPSNRMAVESGVEEKLKQPIPSKKTSAPGKLQEPATGAKSALADRFSSNLAGIIARGPSPMTPPVNLSEETKSRTTTTDQSSREELQSQAPQLTHATKSRARGPKRRLPTSVKPDETKESISRSETPKDVTRFAKSPVTSSEALPSSISGILRNTASLSSLGKQDDKPQPSSKPVFLAQSTDDLKSRIPSSRPFTPPITPKPTPKSPPATKPKRLPSDTMANALKQDGRDSVGLGITSPIAEQVLSPPSPVARSPKSPPTPAKKSEALSRIVSNGTLASQRADISRSPTLKTTEAKRIITDFFDEVPSSNVKLDVNTQEVLTNSSFTNTKIKTLRREIWEITGHGKRVPIPTQQEHILFEDNMYLCNHVFGSASGKRNTETYLWGGDGVSSSSIEDVQVFCRNAAKEAGGKLIVLKQGKESSNFFEALGGTIITRKGSSSGSSSVAYMLCGRRHMGQIAFDEVKFAPGSLCSAFPYLVAVPSGKLYLWKGKGSGTYELACARLIGTNLGVSGEIEEIEEDSEPDAFWRTFKPSEKRVATAEYWPRKAVCENFCTRLFIVDDNARPKSSTSSMWSRLSGSPTREDGPSLQIKEISPYCQADLPRDGVAILDAFFEIYIIVGAMAVSKFSAFRTGLLFAQDYGILAASLEDRPFVPISTVVFEGVPLDMSFAFRKWEHGLTVTKLAGSEVALTTPLNAALEALGRE